MLRFPTTAMLALLVLCATMLAACGDDQSLESARKRADDAARQQVDADANGQDETADIVTPRQAARIGRELDDLAKAFAPVSARINFLVTAETLREDAVQSDTSKAAELERTGAVRLEARRLRTVLADARPAVANVETSGTTARNVQQLLLAAIDARARSLQLLESTLDGIAAKVGDSIVDERFARYRAAWEESVRSTRDATTVVQEERARIGLEPALEEDLR